MNGWTDLQWQLFQQAYEHEIEDSRLAHKIVPESPIAASARSTPVDVYNYNTRTVDDVSTVPLEERQQVFRLTKAQSEDDDLSSAQLVVRRAAQQLARDDDERVFVNSIRDPISNAPAGSTEFHPIVEIERKPADGRPTGDGLPGAVAEAVAVLDADGYRVGYVLVAGPFVYRLLHTRAPGSADLPVVAVRGLLADGPIHRCSVLDPEEALVISMGAGRIDRVVAVSPMAEFLRVEPRQLVSTRYAVGAFTNGLLPDSVKLAASFSSDLRHKGAAIVLQRPRSRTQLATKDARGQVGVAESE